MPNTKEIEKIVDKMDAEIMDWFYECVKINFGVEMVQDSTELREILKRNLKEERKALIKEIEKLKDSFVCRACGGKLGAATGLGKIVFEWQCGNCGNYQEESEKKRGFIETPKLLQGK